MVYAVILGIGKATGLSVGIALAFKMAVVALAVLFGAWIGVRWGGAREYAAMKEE